MPFASSGLRPLLQASGFSLWHYVTTDSRAEVTAPGYFGEAASRFRPGDLLLLQAADALALLPLRAGPAFGPGVTLDGAVAPFAVLRSAAQNFSFTQAVAAVVRTIVLAPLAAGIIAGGTIPVSAQVQGPVSQVLVSLRDASGQMLPGAQVVTVQGGFATAAIPAPPVGSGYRIRMEDVEDPAVAATSRPFSVAPAPRALRQEGGFALLMENGFALLVD
ncbi:MAG: hypothetical protein RMK64_04505 [Rhodovarius sp.]|nr:hypothetical protein [Rhodovarius sp.]MDW8314211.1 hypothetical protein [Rhodovarius sp.]